MARPKPRKWTPKNPEKYVGDSNNIVTRSSWETLALNFFDENPSVIYYNSEDIKIPYFSPIDLKMHNYHPDFLVKLKTKDGNVKTFLVEIKPYIQCRAPVMSKNKKGYMAEMCTWKVNEAKWTYAKEFCNKMGIEFLILDEYMLGIKKNKREDKNG